MTSERNAKDMLAKLATLSCWMRRVPAVYFHARGVGALILMSVSVIACGHRLDKAKTKISDARVDVAGQSMGSPSGTARETRDTKQATTTPLPEGHEGYGAHTMRTISMGAISRHAASIFEGVLGEASFSLEPSLTVGGTPTSDASREVKSHDVARTYAHAAASDENPVYKFHWAFWLGGVALLAIGGLVLALVVDARRHRRLRMAIRQAAAVANDEFLGDGAVFASAQKDAAKYPLVSDDDASLMAPEPIFTLLIEGGTAPESVDSDLGPIPFSRLEWRYSPGKFDATEQWSQESAVDFLPVSLKGPKKDEVLAFESGESAESTKSVGSVAFTESVVPVMVDECAAREMSPVQSDGEAELESAMDDNPLAQLFDQLEHCAIRESSDVPALLIERDSDLPQIMRTTAEAVPQQVLQTWESTLRQAIADARSLTLPSLLVSTLLLRADDADPHDAEALYAEAEKWIDLSMAADYERRTAWEARRLTVDLHRARRKKGAARLLWLRSMQAHYAPQLVQGEPQVLLAWIDVLMLWAQSQLGDAALSRYTEAETVCLRLVELPACVEAAQRRRAEVLRQRATIEQGGARMHSLDKAQALTDALYESTPNADNALAIAVTALARGKALPGAQAKEAYSHALMHAFMAEGDPRWREQALQCRLAVQWAYESLPGMDVQSDVALRLAERLETLRVKDPDTLHRMAKTYLRSADFARACQLCEHAWRNGHATPALLSTWQEACGQWANVSPQPEQFAARRQTMRQLSIASAMR